MKDRLDPRDLPLLDPEKLGDISQSERAAVHQWLMHAATQLAEEYAARIEADKRAA